MMTQAQINSAIDCMFAAYTKECSVTLAEANKKLQDTNVLVSEKLYSQFQEALPTVDDTAKSDIPAVKRIIDHMVRLASSEYAVDTDWFRKVILEAALNK
jgi:hypothetical protein